MRYVLIIGVALCLLPACKTTGTDKGSALTTAKKVGCKVLTAVCKYRSVFCAGKTSENVTPGPETAQASVGGAIALQVALQVACTILNAVCLNLASLCPPAGTPTPSTPSPSAPAPAR